MTSTRLASSGFSENKGLGGVLSLGHCFLRIFSITSRCSGKWARTQGRMADSSPVVSHYFSLVGFREDNRWRLREGGGNRVETNQEPMSFIKSEPWRRNEMSFEFTHNFAITTL